MSECNLPLYHIQTAGRRNEGTSFLPSGYSVMTLTFSYSKMGERCVYLHEMYGMETAKRCSHCIERVCSEGHVVKKEYQVCRQIGVQDSPPFQECALSVKYRST